MSIDVVWQPIVETLNDPHRLHAVLMHLPVAISVLGFVLLLALVLMGGKSPGLRWSAVLLYLIAVVFAVLATNVGKQAMAQLDVDAMTAPAVAQLSDHAKFGELLWLGFAATAMFAVFTGVRSVPTRVIFLVLAVLASLFALGWTAATAHHGWSLVYVHGVGVPDSPNNLPAQPAPGAEEPAIEGDDDEAPAPQPTPDASPDEAPTAPGDDEVPAVPDPAAIEPV